MLDEATRKRRQLRQLEALEKDNFHDDPHAAFAHLTAKAKLPAFADGMEGKTVHFCIDSFVSSWCPYDKSSSCVDVSDMNMLYRGRGIDIAS